MYQKELTIYDFDWLINFLYSGLNGEIVYTLTSNEFFELEQYSDQVGNHLDLVPKKSLDREKTATVNLQLHASNSNKKEFVTTIPVLIRVLDQNEHSPTFSKKVFCSWYF